ncbi:MAG TPA: hypothetical protein VFZ97_11855 [Acidimicrobiales bacterium]
MDDRQGGIPASDDTAAFQRFYAQEPVVEHVPSRSILYRVFVGWWRDRS